MGTSTKTKASFVVVGSSVYYAVSSENGHYSYAKGIKWVSHKKGRVYQGYLSRAFIKMSQAKEVFHFTTAKDGPHLSYALMAREGEVALEVLSSEGEVLEELAPETNYQVIVTIEMAKDGRFAFDGR